MIFDSITFLNPLDNDPIEISGTGATNFVIASGSSEPGDPEIGELFFRNDLGELRVFNGTWISVGSNVSISASSLTGTVPDSVIPVTAVTQHQAALTILESQIVDGSILARIAAPETITGTWSFSSPVTVASPTTASHAATKLYVDSVAQGISTKPSVRVATTGNLTATYNNGAAGVGATLTATSNGAIIIDGVTLSVGNGVLVKNQATAAHNGRYNVTQVGDGSNPWILTRCGLCDEASEIPGAYVFVQDGTQAGTGWVQLVANPATFVVGTDAIMVTQFSGAGTYIPGFGINISGNTISVSGTAAATPTTVMLRDGSGNTSVVGLNASGDITSTGTNFYLGDATSTSTVLMELGRNRTGNGASIIDLWAASTPGDYNARLARNSGVNGILELRQRGSGALQIISEGTSNIEFHINNTLVSNFNSSGALVFAGTAGINWTALSNFSVSANIGTGNPGINFDVNDFIDFNRGTNRMRFFVGSEALSLASGTATFRSNQPVLNTQDYINLVPSNYGAGTPLFYIKTTTNATPKWDLGLWDGSTHNVGILSIYAGEFDINAAGGQRISIGSNGAVNLPSNIASTSISTGSLVVTGGVGISGAVNAETVNARSVNGIVSLDTDAGGSVSLGRRDNFASTPYIDFNSGAVTTDWDARIQTTGGDGTVGGGNLDFRAVFISMLGGVLERNNDLGVNVSGNITISLKGGNYVSMTLTGNTTFSFTNMPFSGRVGTLVLEITNGGAFTVTWPSSIQWFTGVPPALRVSGSNLVGLIFRANGTIVRGTLIA